MRMRVCICSIEDLYAYYTWENKLINKIKVHIVTFS